MEPRTNRSHGNAHDVRNLLILKSMNLVQHQDCPVFRAQLSQGVEQNRPSLRVLGEGVAGGSPFSLLSGGTDLLPLPDAIFHRIQGLSGGDSRQPPREGAIIFQRAKGEKSPDERFLGDIRRFLGVPHDGQGGAENHILVSAHERGKCLPVPGFGQSNELHVVVQGALLPCPLYKKTVRTGQKFIVDEDFLQQFFRTDTKAYFMLYHIWHPAMPGGI
ncbi:protein of unknown function [Kyrpidia spormannii]|nr:protein of unknown function [Kyrpidia spormannii]